MDALVMLREEHKAIKGMFREFERGDLTVVADFCRELMIHSDMEEAVLYPAIREAVADSKDLVMEGIEEHHEVKLLIGELNVMTPDEDHYKAKATVVRENSEHHFGEEEETCSRRFARRWAATGSSSWARRWPSTGPSESTPLGLGPAEPPGFGAVVGG